MEDMFGQQVIKAVLFASYFYLICLGSGLLPMILFYIIREFCTITVVELD